LPNRWGVVQLVGHLTVNEDGEGSNPSAPANFFQLPISLPHVHRNRRSNGVALISPNVSQNRGAKCVGFSSA